MSESELIYELNWDQIFEFYFHGRKQPCVGSKSSKLLFHCKIKKQCLHLQNAVFFFNSNFKVFSRPFNRAGRRVENRVVSCLWLQTGRNIWWITARSRSYSPHYWQSNSPTLWSNQWFNRCDGVSWCSDQSQVCDWTFRRIFICVYISGQTGTWGELYDLCDLYVFNNICTLCGILSCMTDSWLQIWPHVRY